MRLPGCADEGSDLARQVSRIGECVGVDYEDATSATSSGARGGGGSTGLSSQNGVVKQIWCR